LQNKSNKKLKTGKWIQTENFMNINLSKQEDTKGKIGTWKEFMNDRLLSKKYKKQLPCD
jgi:hypothetical protein